MTGEQIDDFDAQTRLTLEYLRNERCECVLSIRGASTCWRCIEIKNLTDSLNGEQ